MDDVLVVDCDDRHPEVLSKLSYKKVTLDNSSSRNFLKRRLELDSDSVISPQKTLKPEDVMRKKSSTLTERSFSQFLNLSCATGNSVNGTLAGNSLIGTPTRENKVLSAGSPVSFSYNKDLKETKTYKNGIASPTKRNTLLIVDTSSSMDEKSTVQYKNISTVPNVSLTQPKTTNLDLSINDGKTSINKRILQLSSPRSCVNSLTKNRNSQLTKKMKQFSSSPQNGTAPLKQVFVFSDSSSIEGELPHGHPKKGDGKGNGPFIRDEKECESESRCEHANDGGSEGGGEDGSEGGSEGGSGGSEASEGGSRGDSEGGSEGRMKYDSDDESERVNESEVESGNCLKKKSVLCSGDRTTKKTSLHQSNNDWEPYLMSLDIEAELLSQVVPPPVVNQDDW
eukprot:TRINITY_DN16898_c0_g1_i2.p1 TRINITY_DN16898_c0_g1~~TRINITY_DN16898_c0_g1_i2.p1  ORF type:complete len:396 (+),score=90.76 TRINITY_DN16898_c0_g1_i2:1397-2584(+)